MLCTRRKIKKKYLYARFDCKIDIIQSDLLLTILKTSVNAREPRHKLFENRAILYVESTTSGNWSKTKSNWLLELFSSLANRYR